MIKKVKNVDCFVVFNPLHHAVYQHIHTRTTYTSTATKYGKSLEKGLRNSLRMFFFVYEPRNGSPNVGKFDVLF